MNEEEKDVHREVFSPQRKTVENKPSLPTMYSIFPIPSSESERKPIYNLMKILYSYVVPCVKYRNWIPVVLELPEFVL